MSYCPKCGNQVVSGSRFCQSCGQTVGQNRTQDNSADLGQYSPQSTSTYSQAPTPTNSYSGNNYQQNNSQGGLVTGAYICAGLSLLFLPIILGPLGVILGVIANSNGDERGKTAAIVSGVCMVLGMIIGVLFFAAMFY